GLEALDLVLELDLALAQEHGLLEILVRDGLLHLLDDGADLRLQPPQVLRVGHAAQLHLRAGLVEDVDGLVGEKAVGDVAVRLVDRAADGGVAVLDLVEGLVALLDALQDLQRLVLVRRIHIDGLEAAEQRAILLDVAAILADRGRADAGDLAARQRRLEDVGRVERAFRGAGPDQRVDLVDEDDDVGVLFELFDDPLEALFELAAVLRSGDDERQVEREDALVGDEERHVAVDDALGQPLDDGGLADARLAEEDRVVLGAAGEDLDDPLHFLLAADERIELGLMGHGRQVARVLGQEGELFLLLVGLALLQDRDRLLAHAVDVEAFGGEDARGGRRLHAEDADEEVLGA